MGMEAVSFYGSQRSALAIIPKLKLRNEIDKAISEASVFTVTCLVGSGIVRFIIPPIAPILAGAGLISFPARLVINATKDYNTNRFIQEQVCKFNEKRNWIHVLGVIVALVTSFFIPYVGVALGLGLGIYGSIIIDVENHKLLQRSSRHISMKK